ncbi:MAG TPA: hypothetical protein VJV78_27960 [Polyangiales bacterium]|nr:hypothetical protein [Polyangiales bacterium]
MKFFIYISDARVDALLAELSAAQRAQLSDQLRLDASWLELAETPRDAPDELRFARAEAIAHTLEQGGESASLGQGKAYVGATRPLHWGRLRHVRGAELLRHESESPVWFADLAAGLIMVGSASRMVAQPPAARTDHARCAVEPEAAWYTPVRDATAFDALDLRCLSQAFEPAPVLAEGAEVELPDFTREPVAPEAWMQRLAALPQELAVLPLQRLEFSAKRLASFTGRHGEALVLAAPVFVAMSL